MALYAVDVLLAEVLKGLGRLRAALGVARGLLRPVERILELRVVRLLVRRLLRLGGGLFELRDTPGFGYAAKLDAIER